MLLWNRIRISHLTIGSFILFAVFCSVLFASPSYATSVNCSNTFTDIAGSTSYQFVNGCDTSSLDSSASWFYRVSFSGSPTPSRNVNATYCFSDSVLSSCGTSYAPFMFRSSTSIWSNYSTLFMSDSPSYRFTYFTVSPTSGTLSYTGDLTLSVLITDSPFGSDSCPSSPSGEITISSNGTYDVSSYASASVDVQNEVIQGDYHDDLVNIKNSIIVCGAILLVIYFFYAIYKLIISPLGGKL